MSSNVTYSWPPAPRAVSYIIDLKSKATGQEYSYETTDTSITFPPGLPTGSYELTVRAKYADGSTGIIIEDVVDI